MKQASSGCIDGIAEVQEKNVAVGDYSKNCIAVYTPNGQFVREFNVSGGPSGLAVSTRGQLFVAEYLSHRVSVFNQSGHYQYSFGSEGGGPGQFQNHEQICITPDGLVCVTDGGNNRVQVFEQGGEFVRQFGKDVLKSPSGVAMTKDGHVVLANYVRTHIIYVVFFFIIHGSFSVASVHSYAVYKLFELILRIFAQSRSAKNSPPAYFRGSRRSICRPGTGLSRSTTTSTRRS